MPQIRKFNESLPMLLLRARETAMAYFRPSLQEHGVTEQQWRVLRALNETDALTAAALSHECVILAPSMTRILRTLSDKDLVVVVRSPLDGRELQISLTRTGRRLIAEMGPISERQYALIRERLDPERLEQLYRLLHEFVEIEDERGDKPVSAALGSK
jgi:homoprotocatechuate degradation regulator HpaR